VKKYIHLGYFCISVPFILIGCATADQSTNSSTPIAEQKRVEKPEWIFSPSKEGRIGGVGIAGSHIRGPSAQRELAISRALDEIAKQMNIKIATITKTSASTSGGSASSSLDTFSFQTSDGQTVKAYINKIWQDPYTEELYVWMLSNK
jgi:hypothetical protein